MKRQQYKNLEKKYREGTRKQRLERERRNRETGKNAETPPSALLERLEAVAKQNEQIISLLMEVLAQGRTEEVAEAVKVAREKVENKGKEMTSTTEKHENRLAELGVDGRDLNPPRNTMDAMMKKNIPAFDYAQKSLQEFDKSKASEKKVVLPKRNMTALDYLEMNSHEAQTTEERPEPVIKNVEPPIILEQPVADINEHLDKILPAKNPDEKKEVEKPDESQEEKEKLQTFTFGQLQKALEALLAILESPNTKNIIKDRGSENFTLSLESQIMIIHTRLNDLKGDQKDQSAEATASEKITRLIKNSILGALEDPYLGHNVVWIRTLDTSPDIKAIFPEIVLKDPKTEKDEQKGNSSEIATPLKSDNYETHIAIYDKIKNIIMFFRNPYDKIVEKILFDLEIKEIKSPNADITKKDLSAIRKAVNALPLVEQQQFIKLVKEKSFVKLSDHSQKIIHWAFADNYDKQTAA